MAVSATSRPPGSDMDEATMPAPTPKSEPDIIAPPRRAEPVPATVPIRSRQATSGSGTPGPEN